MLMMLSAELAGAQSDPALAVCMRAFSLARNSKTFAATDTLAGHRTSRIRSFAACQLRGTKVNVDYP